MSNITGIKTSRRQFLAATSALTAAAATGLARPALAQAYPSQDIHFVCGFPAGSGADIIVRFFADKIRPAAGKTIIVENRESYNDAEVIAVGPDAREVKAGDRIRYGNGDYLKWDLVEIDGEKYQVISEADEIGRAHV